MKLAKIQNKQRIELLVRIEEAFVYRRLRPDGQTYTVSGLKQLIQEARKFNSETEQKLPQLQIDISVFEEELPYLEKEEIQARIEEALAYMRANPAGETYTVSGLKQLIQEARKFNSETEQKLPLWRRKK